MAAALLVSGATWSGRASAQGRWVDDERVLMARRVRLSAGLGIVRFESPSLSGRSQAFWGSGLNLEESVGLGKDLEAGVRFGLRMERAGQGLRADEPARVLDTETFGTGLSVTANPELRLRWRAAEWSWGEAGLEDRVVLPILPDPNVTELFGMWTSLRVRHLIRVDLGVNAVFSLESFAEKRIVTSAFGVPLYVWSNLTQGLFVGVLTTTHYFAPSRYTTGEASWMAGVGVGYRIVACDVLQSTVLPDVSEDSTRRVALGLALACRL